MPNTSSSPERNAVQQHHAGPVPSGAGVLSASPGRPSPACAPADASGHSALRPRTRAGVRRELASGAALTFEGRVATLKDEGFTERQAAFLVTVMLHAGVCMVRQYCALPASRTATTPASSSHAWSSGASPRRTRPRIGGRASTTFTIDGCTPPSESRTAAFVSRCR